jgi:hypothetical protein
MICFVAGVVPLTAGCGMPQRTNVAAASKTAICLGQICLVFIVRTFVAAGANNAGTRCLSRINVALPTNGRNLRRCRTRRRAFGKPIS